MTDQLIVGRQDAVATVTFNRPEARNALSLDMRAALCEAMLGLERDKAVRCVVLRGTGDHFMGGGDIKRFHGIIDNDPEELYAGFLNGIQEMHRAIVAMRRMGKPVVASVRGAAAGLGCSLVLACDLAIAADDAFFTLAYSRLGTSPDGSGSYFLPRTVGTKKAAEIALLGDRYDAETARPGPHPRLRQHQAAPPRFAPADPAGPASGRGRELRRLRRHPGLQGRRPRLRRETRRQVQGGVARWPPSPVGLSGASGYHPSGRDNTDPRRGMEP
jgi:hypothetical protein